MSGLSKFAGWWLIFLGHHPLDELDHMLCLHARGQKFFLCARCTGQYAGVLAGFLATPYLPGLGTWGLLLLSLLLPAPATWDWFTQLSQGRPSSNWIRIPTGGLFGLLLGHWAHRLWAGNWADFPVILGTIVGYITLVTILCALHRDLVVGYVERYERFVRRWAAHQE